MSPHLVIVSYISAIGMCRNRAETRSDLAGVYSSFIPFFSLSLFLSSSPVLSYYWRLLFAFPHSSFLPSASIIVPFSHSTSESHIYCSIYTIYLEHEMSGYRLLVQDSQQSCVFLFPWFFHYSQYFQSVSQLIIYIELTLSLLVGTKQFKYLSDILSRSRENDLYLIFILIKQLFHARTSALSFFF